MQSRRVAQARAAGLMALGLASASAAILLADFVAPSPVASTSKQADLDRIAGQAFASGAERGIFMICVGPDGAIVIDRSGLGSMGFTEACTGTLRDLLIEAASAVPALSFYASDYEDLQVDFSAGFEASEAVAYVGEEGGSDQSLDTGADVVAARSIAVPEPSSFPLVLGGLVGIAVRRRSRG